MADMTPDSSWVEAERALFEAAMRERYGFADAWFQRQPSGAYWNSTVGSLWPIWEMRAACSIPVTVTEARVEAVEGRKPKFGDRIVNPWASDNNPTKAGIFVREFRRTGKLNPGTIWEFTDGNGKFWEINRRAFFEDRACITAVLEAKNG